MTLLSKVTPITDPALGRRIRALRLRRKITQDIFAEAVGAGQATISRLERGEGAVGVPLSRILKALHARPEDLFDHRSKGRKGAA